MKSQQKENPADGRQATAAAGLAALVLALAYPAESPAQETQFGIDPGANTQRALRDSPAQSTRDEGLYAALGVSYYERSNVRRESDEAGGESDRALVLTPQAGYKRGFGRHSAEVGVSTLITRYDEFDTEDTDNYTIDGLINLDVTRILDVDLFGAFTDATEARGTSGTDLLPTLEPDKVEITTYGGVATLGRQASRLRIQVGADRSEWRYQNNQQQFRDRDEDRIHGRVYYNVSPRTALFTGASLTDVTYQEQGVKSDSEELGYEVGGRWDITAKTRGEVSVGRTEKDFDDPLLADAEETTFAGRLSWAARPRTTFNLYGSRQFEESADIGDAFYVSELVGASVSQSFGSRWGAYAYYNQTNDDFDNGRKDDIVDYGVGLDYALRRWLSVGAQYSVIERDSNFPGESYEDEIVSLYLNGQFEFRR